MKVEYDPVRGVETVTVMAPADAGTEDWTPALRGIYHEACRDIDKSVERANRKLMRMYINIIRRGMEESLSFFPQTGRVTTLYGVPLEDIISGKEPIPRVL